MNITLDLPQNAEVKVKNGQKVTIGDPLYDIGKEETDTIQVTTQLKVKPEEIFQHVTTVVGATVKAGTVIAQKKGVIGSKKVSADKDGIVQKIDHTTGDVILQTQGNTKKAVASAINGVIESVDVSKNNIIFQVADGFQCAISACTGFAGGKLTFTEDETFYTLSEDIINASVICIHTLSPALAAKIETLDGEGIVYVVGETSGIIPTCKISPDDFESLRKKSYEYVVFSPRENQLVAYT